MPSWQGRDPAELTPEDLLPQTPPRKRQPPLPPRPEQPLGGKVGGGLLPKISLTGYQPAQEAQDLMDEFGDFAGKQVFGE